MAYSSNIFVKQLPEWADDQSIGSCSICLIVYDEVKVPKLLNCGHTFCLGCTQSLMTQQTIIKCPTCRHETDATVAPLPTNYELAGVLTKFAERQAEVRKGEVTCQECFNAIAHQKVRCCKTCNTPSSGKICSDCCVENHNGHELVTLVKYFEQQCKELIGTFEEHRNTVASLQKKIETQHEEISLLLSKIQSLVHIRREGFDHEVKSIAQDLNDVGAENKLEVLQQQKTSEKTLFSSTEATLNEIVVLNNQMLAIETAAINKLTGTAERERGNLMVEHLSAAFALNDDEQSSTHSAFHSLNSMRENMEAIQAEAAASCSAEDALPKLKLNSVYGEETTPCAECYEPIPKAKRSYCATCRTSRDYSQACKLICVKCCLNSHRSHKICTLAI
uniref:RING-type domain-containing protein n=1 Tax=Plectus sambesii TaxID=2011161 RepID=A0A914WQZ5_9BILA